MPGAEAIESVEAPDEVRWARLVARDVVTRVVPESLHALVAAARERLTAEEASAIEAVAAWSAAESVAAWSAHDEAQADLRRSPCSDPSCGPGHYCQRHARIYPLREAIGQRTESLTTIGRSIEAREGLLGEAVMAAGEAFAEGQRAMQGPMAFGPPRDSEIAGHTARYAARSAFACVAALHAADAHDQAHTTADAIVQRVIALADAS